MLPSTHIYIHTYVCGQRPVCDPHFCRKFDFSQFYSKNGPKKEMNLLPFFPGIFICVPFRGRTVFRGRTLTKQGVSAFFFTFRKPKHNIFVHLWVSSLCHLLCKFEKGGPGRLHLTFLILTFGRLILYTSSAGRCCLFFTIQRQWCIEILCPKDPEFYTPLALNCQKGQTPPSTGGV